MKNFSLPTFSVVYVFLMAISSCTLDKEPEMPTGITNENVPVFVSTDLERVSEHSVSAWALLNSFGNLNILRYGWVWSENPEPTLEDSKIEMENLEEDSFRIEIPGLAPGKRYYIRPYVVTGSGEVYGPEKETTLISTFQKTYEGTGAAFQQTRDGGFILLGRLYHEETNETEINLIKTDAVGEVEWEKRFDLGDDFVFDVQQTAEGGYIILGLNNGIHLIKTNALGDLEWEKNVGSATVGHSIQQTDDGGFMVLGYSEENFWEAMYLAKVNSSGDLDWEKTFAGDYDAAGNSIQKTTDGGYILTGINDYELYLAKTDPSGSLTWETMIGGDSIETQRGNAARQTSDGGFIVVGECFDESTGGSKKMCLFKTNSTGEVQWKKIFDDGSWGTYGKSVQQTFDGGFILLGTIENAASNMFLVKTNSAGELQWKKSLGGAGSQEGISVLQISDGGFVLFGSTPLAPTEGRMYLFKTDNNGNTY